MKKYNCGTILLSGYLKYLIIMKLIIILICTAALQAVAFNSSSQGRINLDLKSTTITSVLKKIEDKYNYRFVYDDQVGLNSAYVDVYAKNATIDYVMQQLLKTTTFSYRKINEVLVVVTGKQALDPALPIKGKVVDENGNPLEGVSISVKGGNIGTTTNTAGEFTLNADEGAVLVISYVGYGTQEIVVGPNAALGIIVLTGDGVKMDDILVVGYGTQRKSTLTGAVAAVKADQLEKVPIASASNALAGRLPGLVSLQQSGQPGSDRAYLSIRGFGNPLVIVDGVEADFNSIDANQIESISILKDASASIYGSRAGNGVILVTTKRGNTQKPEIGVKTSYTLQSVTFFPKKQSSGQMAQLANEAWLNSASTTTRPYTDEEVAKYYDGTDPRFPNTDWNKELIRNWAPQKQHNISIRGGSERIKYYGFLGYLDQETMWKKSGGGYKRYNLQSNIDAKILDNLSMQLDMATAIEQRDFAWRYYSGGSDVWNDLWNTSPMFPASFPDPDKISWAEGGGTGGAHVTTNRDLSGYADEGHQDIRATLSFKYDFRPIPGLSLKTFANYYKTYDSRKRFGKAAIFYLYDYDANIYTQKGSMNNPSNLEVQKSEGYMLTENYSLNYDKKIGNHNVSAMALYETIVYSSDWVRAYRERYLSNLIDQLSAGSTDGMRNDGSASENGRKSAVGRLRYDYMSKYLFEGTFRADASSRFPKETRWGYFPSVLVGWAISKENFLANVNSIDELKLRASYGQSGIDNVGNYDYYSGYGITIPYIQGGPYLFGSTYYNALGLTNLANPALTWEKMTISNLGLDFSFLKRKIYGEANVFYRKREGIPATRLSSIPTSFGAPLPKENLNSQNNRGFDLMLGTAGKSADFRWDISGNISWNRAKWDHYEEPEYTEEWQIRTNKNSGNWTDRSIGYLTDGLFTSQEEINNLGYNQDGNDNKNLRPGDVKIIDYNKDGKINQEDMVVIGKGNVPNWMAGLNMNVAYRNFDLSALLQGAFGYSTGIAAKGGSTLYFEERWTPENNRKDGIVPRPGSFSPTNGYASDFWLKDAGYLRLKTISLGYQLPAIITSRINVKMVKAYIAAFNILTFNKLAKYQVDPEFVANNPGGSYPQQKTITVGLNISL